MKQTAAFTQSNHTAVSFRLDLPAVLGPDVACTMSCPWCHKDYFPVSSPVDGKRSVSFYESIELAEQAVSLQESEQRVYHISGRADPLVIGPDGIREQLAPLAPAFNRYEAVVTTNGILLGKCWQALHAVNIQRVNISGSTDPVHYRWKKFVRMAVNCGFNTTINYLVTCPDYDRLRSDIRFALVQGIPMKLFLLLGMDNETEQELQSELDRILREETGAAGRYVPSKHRVVYGEDWGTALMVKLRTDTSPNRLPACSTCSRKVNCTEGCWRSIRITPWYIKPCGIREDNVYYFEEDNLDSLRKKLVSGGKCPGGSGKV